MQLANAYEAHLVETRGHQRLAEDRLHAHGSSPSKLEDTVLSHGARNRRMFFQAQPDTPGRLFAFEHLEITAYELMKRVAERAGDGETSATVARIVADERGAAATLAGHFDRAAELALEGQRAA